MTTLQITQVTDGKKKKEILPFLALDLLQILLFPFRLLFGGRNNYSIVKDNEWTSCGSVNGQVIERNIIAETGFDDIIKFYRLRTTDKQIDRLLAGKVFGEFIYETNYGLFLRQFNNPGDWPTSYLVFIDKSDNSYRKLKKSKSSWLIWTYEYINDKDFNIITEPADTYTTRIQIKTQLG
jgi:hypothetical protein